MSEEVAAQGRHLVAELGQHETEWRAKLQTEELAVLKLHMRLSQLSTEEQEEKLRHYLPSLCLREARIDTSASFQASAIVPSLGTLHFGIGALPRSVSSAVEESNLQQAEDGEGSGDPGNSSSQSLLLDISENCQVQENSLNSLQEDCNNCLDTRAEQTFTQGTCSTRVHYI